MALKAYASGQKKVEEMYTFTPSGYACSDHVERVDEKTGKKKKIKDDAGNYLPCPGEMMIQHPIKEGWLNADTKNDLVRAVCAECGWRGWVPNDES